MRSNMFANIENRFEFASEEEIVQIAFSSLREIVGSLSGAADEVIFGVVLLGAKLGVAADGKINEKERYLIDTIFEPFSNASMEKIYDFVGETIGEDDYNRVIPITKLGNPLAMSFLNFVLSFGYIDEVFEDEVAEKLDGLFGMNLLADFFNSGMQEVPTPKIKLTGLEAKIFEWLHGNDELKTLEEIQIHFSQENKSEVKVALERLCDKGILYSVETFVGKMYGLA